MTTQELLEYMEQEEDGSYFFRIPTPMQDAKIEVAYKALDPSLVPYTVTLEDAVGIEDGKQVSNHSLTICCFCNSI